MLYDSDSFTHVFFWNLLWDSRKLGAAGASCGLLEPPGTQLSWSLLQPGLLERRLLEPPEASLSLLESPGTSWSLLGWPPGTFWDLLEPPGASWSSWSPLLMEPPAAEASQKAGSSTTPHIPTYNLA
jgi:hypothetical protein